MQSTNVQSTTGNLPVGKRHYGQRTSWQRPIGLNTTGKWMLGKILRGQYDWQANYDRPQKSLPQQKIVIAWQRVVTLRFTPSLLATIAKKPVTVSGLKTS